MVDALFLFPKHKVKMKHKQFLSFILNCLFFVFPPFSASAADYYQSVTMTEGETKTLNAWALSDSQYDVGAKTWKDATSNIVVLQTYDYSATILALSPGSAQIRHNRVYYNNGQKFDNIYYLITINKSSYPKIQLTPSTQSKRVLKGTVLTLTPSVSGSIIYYSTSGNVTPGKSSTFPSSGFTLNNTTTIHAQAVKSGYPLSDVFEHTYTVISNGDFQAKVAGGITLHFKILSESAKTCQLYFVSDTETGELTIPEQVNGYTVKQIGYQACLDCNKLTKVILPNTINSIGAEAFKGCTSLKSINIPEGVAGIYSNTFNGCSNLASIVLPKGLTSIESSAFDGCTTLSSVIIPKTVTSIATNAFASCPNLKSVNSYIHTPFAIEDNVFTNYNSSVTLNVPFGSATKYRSTSGWMQFVNIKEVPDPDIIYITEISLNETEIELFEDDGKMLKATITPTDATDNTVTWTTSNAQVATVSANGLVVGVKEGSAIITCTANDNSGVNTICTVTVKKKPVPVSQIILNKNTLTLEKFKEYQLTATVKPDNATNKDLTWTTDNDQVADVNNTGLVTALAEGTATITCAAIDGSGVKATCIVTIIPRQVLVTDISLNQTSATLSTESPNNTLQLTATVKPENATDKTVTWSSSPTSIATVDVNGRVTAIAEGNATITCMANDGSGVKASCEVTVTAPVVEEYYYVGYLNEWNVLDNSHPFKKLSDGETWELTMPCMVQDEFKIGTAASLVDGWSADVYGAPENDNTVLSGTMTRIYGPNFIVPYTGGMNSYTVRIVPSTMHYEITINIENQTNILVDATNFPDENFRKYLLEQDYGKDGVLTESEISGVDEMVFSFEKIGSLKGIEFFTALTKLYCSGNKLTSLDVSKNTALTQLYCSDNKLTSLDVSKNTALTALECYKNQLTSLDVSKNTALSRLYCYSNQIKGVEMDNLISSLPQNATNDIYYFRVIDPTDKNEGNVCTKAQVANIKAKGWIPQCYDGSHWGEYEGSEPSGISNVTIDGQTGTPVFSLSGQRHAAPKKGINIVGGKKIIIK